MKHIKTPKITLKKASEMAEKEKTEQQVLVFLEQNFDAYIDTIMDLLRSKSNAKRNDL